MWNLASVSIRPPARFICKSSPAGCSVVPGCFPAQDPVRESYFQHCSFHVLVNHNLVQFQLFPNKHMIINKTKQCVLIVHWRRSGELRIYVAGKLIADPSTEIQKIGKAPGCWPDRRWRCWCCCRHWFGHRPSGRWPVLDCWAGMKVFKSFIPPIFFLFSLHGDIFLEPLWVWFFNGSIS